MLQLAQNTHRESVILFTLTTVDRDSTQRFCDHHQSLDMGYGTAATHAIIETYTLETGISHVDSCSERVLLLHREFFFFAPRYSRLHSQGSTNFCLSFPNGE